MLGRGLFSGVIWGAVVALGAIWLALQIGEMTSFLSKAPENVSDRAPDVAPVETTTLEDPPSIPAERAAPATDPSRQGTGLANSDADPMPSAQTQPATQPRTTEPKTPDLVQANGDAPAVEGAGDAVLPVETPVTALEPPVADASPVKPTAPETQAVTLPPVDATEQAVPELPAGDSGDRPAADTAPSVAADPGKPDAPGNDIAPVVDFSNPVEVVTPPTPEPAPDVAEPPASVQIAAADPQAEPRPIIPATPEIAPEAVPGQAPATGDAPTPPSPDPAPESQPEPQPEPVQENVAAKTPPRDGPIKQPIAGISDKAPNVTVNRLPTIGGEVEPPAQEETVPQETAPGDTALPPEGGPAIEMFAADFENPDGRPLMAILLIVDPDDPVAGDGLAPLPFPASYVVNANRDNAWQIMRAYRDAGNEVVALAPLPARAAPSDVEVAFQSYFAAVPEAVAIMDTRGAIFQSGRAVATQVAEALAASGHGMITYSRGLNSAMQVAERSNVPAAIVFREFDNDGQNAAAIKRFLDQAAFRAGQQTGVILLGHNRPETIAALLEWSLGNRASTVALAPVSAALLAQ